MNKKEYSLLLGLVLALAITFIADANISAAKVRENTLRLHVIAASDSQKDQEMKLKVRDAILSLSSEIYHDADNIEKALDATNKNLDLLNAIANDTLTKMDAPYSGSCSVEKFYFDTTEYEDFTMPKGEYLALTVRLGEAKGKNWWCVVYPSLCVGTSDASYEDEDCETFIQTEKFDIKFKAVELLETVKGWIQTPQSPEYTHLGN